MITTRRHSFISIIVLLALVLVWTSPTPARTAATAPSEPLPWIDDFSSTALDPRWTISNEDSNLWSLTERPGYLRLHAYGNLFADPATLRNLFLTPLPAEAFQATLVFETTLTRTGQGAGLLLYEDPSNLVQFYRYFDGTKDIIRIRQINALEVTDMDQLAGEAGPTYLRLILDAGFVSAWYSLDGASWETVAEIPIHSYQVSLGMMAYNNNPGLGDLVVDVDSFSLEPVSDVSQAWQNLGLYGGGPDPRYYGIAFDTATDNAYACLTEAVYGLYRLPYGATAWEPVLTSGGGCLAMAIDNTHHWIYRVRDNMLFRSQDSGATWKLVYMDEEGIPNLIHLPAAEPEWIFLGDTNPSENGGRLLRSTDMGVTWEPVLFSPNAGDSLTEIPNCKIWRVDSDPTNADWVYASFGNRQPGCAYRGIYRSQDGGQTFTRFLEDQDAQGVGVSVGPTGIVFAGVNSQLQRSNDHGDTWTPLAVSGGAVITFHPTQPNLIFRYNFRSEDYGDTWEYTGLTQAVIHPNHTDTYLYPENFNFRISYDAGQTVTPINTGIEEVKIWRIAADPADPQHMFIADTVNLGRTQDGGQTWDYPLLIDTGYGVVIDPVNPDVVYALNWGGLGFKKSVDGGDTWNSYDIPPYPDTEIWENNLILDPEDSQVGYLSIATKGPPQHDIWGGVHKTEDGGETWTLVGLEDYPVEVVVWGWSSQELFAGVRTTWDDSRTGGVYHSTDGGVTWQPIGLDEEYILSLAVDPGNPGHILAGTQSDGIWKTEDFGQNWTQVRTGRFVYDISVDERRPFRVLAAVDGGLYESLDAGDTWSALYAYRPSVGVVYTVDIGLLNPRPRLLNGDSRLNVLIGNSRGLYAVQLEELQEIFLPLAIR